jgi:phosphoglycolate phosphatase-like HAD superfamily hydrolase
MKTGRDQWQTALVFDFDGTLVDSGDIKQRAYDAAISEALDSTEDERRSAYRLFGTQNRVPQLAQAFLKLSGRPPEQRELDAMLETYGRCVRDESATVRPFDGIRELLRSQGLRHLIAIASNAPQDELEATCRALALDELVDVTYGYPTSKEDAVEQILLRWQLSREHLVYVGDRPEDEQVALRTQVHFCRFGPLEPQTDARAIRTVPELERALDGVFGR